MATTLIENVKKYNQNFCYFDDIKIENHFYGNIKVCNFMLFQVFLNVSYVIITWIPEGPFCQICILMYYIEIGLTVLTHSLFG